jgi:threonine 3-dehydrogenase
MALGHEIAGTIAEVGPDVATLTPGTRVAVNPSRACGKCVYCQAGMQNECLDMHFIGSAMRMPHDQGGFRQSLTVEATQAVPIAEALSLGEAAMAEPLAVCLHAARIAGPLIGKRVLITGAGPIGCMAAAIAKQVGARHVVVTDINPTRLSLAKRMGATRVVDVSREKLPDVQRELDMKEGFDIGLEMSGSPRALGDMIDNMCHGGRIALLGIMPEKAAIDWNKVVFNMLTIRGIYGREMYETWYKMTALIQSGLDIAPVITHRMPYTEFERGFELMRSGQSGKIVLNWDAS